MGSVDTAVAGNCAACCRGSESEFHARRHAALCTAVVVRGNPAVDIGYFAADWGAGAAANDREADCIDCACCTRVAGHNWAVDIVAATDAASAADVVGRGNSCIAALGPAGRRCAWIGHRSAGLAVR